NITAHRHYFADGLTKHPKAFTITPTSRAGGRGDMTIGTLGRLTHLLHALAHKRRLRTPQGGSLPIYLTEYGYFARGPRSLATHRRAAYLRKGFQIALHNPSVREMTQYTLVSPPRRGDWDTSLVSTNGRPSSVFN